MFEQLGESKKTPLVSIAMALGIFAAYLAGAFGGACLFIALAGRPLGFQIATAITYTYFAFWYVFFPTRGFSEIYSLRNKAVQQQIPRLLTIHGGFLIVIFLSQASWIAIEPRLPSYWLKEHGKRSETLYEWVMIGFFVIVFFTQVLISRGILSRSLRQDAKQ